MRRRAWIVAILTVAVVGLAALGIAIRPQTPTAIKIGYAISMTGASTTAAGAISLPNYRLWVKEVNDSGGIMLESLGKRLPVEVVEYDDEDNADKAVAAIDRLIRHDKVDFLLAPYGPGLNLAVGPVFHRAGYPHLAAVAVSDRIPELAKLWPNSFWFMGTVTEATRPLITELQTLRSEDKVSNRVAMVNVANQFGINLAKAARRALEKAGFDIVYDRSYPVGQDDMRTLLDEIKQLNPDSFIAFSSPPDGLEIAERARASGFNPKVFYLSGGPPLPAFARRFGADAEGVMGYGGWEVGTPETRAYRKRHFEATGKEAARGAGPLVYASLQMLQQAIERVGRIDRAAVIEELQNGTFETVLGPITMEDNRYMGAWQVGQWQGGAFYGIAPTNLPGAQPMLFPKPAWSALNAPQASPNATTDVVR